MSMEMEKEITTNCRTYIYMYIFDIMAVLNFHNAIKIRLVTNGITVGISNVQARVFRSWQFVEIKK